MRIRLGLPGDWDVICEWFHPRRHGLSARHLAQVEGSVSHKHRRPVFCGVIPGPGENPKISWVAMMRKLSVTWSQ